MARKRKSSPKSDKAAEKALEGAAVALLGIAYTTFYLKWASRTQRGPVTTLLGYSLILGLLSCSGLVAYTCSQSPGSLEDIYGVVASAGLFLVPFGTACAILLGKDSLE